MLLDGVSFQYFVSGKKEAILNGQRYEYDQGKYLCCPMAMPVMAGTPMASPESPLLGVLITLGKREMLEIVMDIDAAPEVPPMVQAPLREPGIQLAAWDDSFTDALLRLLQLVGHKTDTAVLAEARLRELLYAILSGGAGCFARQAFRSDNAIARAIACLCSNLSAPVSIDELAGRAGMSRAVFHRKFKQVTKMSPIQFVKAMRLNTAAMKIASGTAVNEAAMDVGYHSPSQFSREFKRMYGRSPRHWGDTQQIPQQISIGVA